jgi:uncharacterized protein (DUF2147 family)
MKSSIFNQMKYVIFILLVVLMIACKKEPEKQYSKTNPTAVTIAEIGYSYEGGVVAYILQPTDQGYENNIQHGLIALPFDINPTSTSMWGNNVITSASDTVLFSGNYNTNKIISINGLGNYSARLCADLVFAGYSDWYLPSKVELNKLYLNRTKIGGFVNNNYWSSSEYSINMAWQQSFGTGYCYLNSKTQIAVVRAVRRF